MPVNWINYRLLTKYDSIYLDDEKEHDLIDLESVGGELVDSELHPILHQKLGGGAAVYPTMPRPTGSPIGYKIVADPT